MDAPPGAREWLTFPDPEEERVWWFDVTFLLSNWDCIFGRGCQGVLTGPAPELVQGCCSYGAHFTGDDDVEDTLKAAEQLTPEEWQFYAKGHTAKGKLNVVRVNKDGDTVTRLADDACIFLNRPEFSAGAGCALHLAAVNRGLRFMDWKPDVCWQLPLRREDTEETDGSVTSRVIQWDREHWGDGGAEFHWWCTEEREAFVGANPVYVAARAELEEMIGAEIYAMLADELDRRRDGGTPLPHPALRAD